ncbi:hypothetical protein BS78_10G132600 [Paspalum vaginatum]|nr:hypothetical protein BS78_10G132600 [Paspalum vaginatum]
MPRVLRSTLLKGFRVPEGKFYLVDGGYTNTPAFLAPYHGTSSVVMFGRGSPKFNTMHKKASPKCGSIKKNEASPKVAKKAGRAYWNPRLEKGLVEILLDHNNDHYRGQNGWSSYAWNRVVRLFHEKFPHASFTKLQIQEKEKELKREYNMLKEERKQSGASWDDRLGMIQAKSAIWDNIIMSFPKIRKFQTKPFPLFDALGELHDGHTAEGSMNFTSLEATPSDPSITQNGDDEHNPPHVSLDDEVSIVKPPDQSGVSTTSKRAVASRTKGFAALDGERKVGKRQKKEATMDKIISVNQVLCGDDKLISRNRRENPITNPTVAELKVNLDGRLVILDKVTKSKIWSSQAGARAAINYTIAVLMNNGNLVLRDASSNMSNVLWQSFDYPTNALLPSAKIGQNKVSALQYSLISKKNTVDFAPGHYCSELDPTGAPQFIQKLCNSSKEMQSLSHKRRTTIICVSITALGLSLGLIIMLMVIYRNRRKSFATIFNKSQGDGSIIAFKYRDLCFATKKFSDKLGSGSFGSVFKGFLHHSSTAIAVKRLDGVGLVLY